MLLALSQLLMQVDPDGLGCLRVLQDAGTTLLW